MLHKLINPQTMRNPIKIAIADRSNLNPERIFGPTLKSNEYFVSFISYNPNDLLLKLKSEIVDILIFHFQFPLIQNSGGAKGIQFLQNHFPKLKIIVFEVYNYLAYYKKYIELGVSAVLLRGTPFDLVKKSISSIRQNGSFFDPRISNQQSDCAPSTTEAQKRPVAFTPIELKIIGLIMDERTSKEIGDALFLSKKAIDAHRMDILKKTNARNVVGIIKYIHFWGLGVIRNNA